VRALCNRCREVVEEVARSQGSWRGREVAGVVGVVERLGGCEVAGVVERSWRGCGGRRGRGEVVSVGRGKFPVWLTFYIINSNTLSFKLDARLKICLGTRE
jgi:hypothetical protein